MSDVPFGFTPREPGDDDDSVDKRGDSAAGAGGTGGFGLGPGGLGGFDPSSMGAGGFDMAQLGAMFSQLGAMMQSGGQGGSDGPVDWETAKRVAREQVVAAGDPSVLEADRTAVIDAVRLADVWLDGATTFPASAVEPAAWSRSEWIEATFPAWQRIVEPIAASMQSAMDDLVPGDGEGGLGALGGLGGAGGLEGLPPELAAMAAPLLGMAKRMGAMMFGAQVGQGIGTLAADVLGAADVGVPLTGDGRAALLPRNVAEFGEGLGVPLDDVRLYLALRESAHQRLFAHVPWLRGRLEGAVEAYARGVHVDRARIEEAMGSVDPQDPAALQEALASGVFAPEDTEEQRAALARLETLLALVEGWVDDVVAQSAGGRLPSAEALRETVRRRRAIGGPAEKTFATLVGLEMRPRRLREAAALWEQLRAERGPEGRDALWAHPDLLPTADDLDDPAGFLARSAPLDLGAIEAELGEDLDGDGTIGSGG